MPAISIADIPKAIARSTAASGMNISPPGSPGMMVKPKAAILGNSAAADAGSARAGAASMRNAARSMLGETLELDAFSQEANAAMNVGRAVGQVGQVAEDIGMKFAAAKDTADIARAETTMRSAFELQQNEQLELPPEKWQENWNRNLTNAQKAITDIKFSNAAAERLMPSWDRWSQLSRVQIDGQARKKQIDGFRTDVQANVMMKVADKDFQGAHVTIDESVNNGIFDPAEGKMLKARIYDNEIAEAKDNNRASANARIINDPQGSHAILKEDVKNGTNNFDPQAEPENIIQYFEASRSEKFRFEAQATNEIQAIIGSGKPITVGEVQDMAKRAGLDQETTNALVAMQQKVYNASPEAEAKAVEQRVRFFNAIEGYNKDQDSDGKVYGSLLQEIMYADLTVEKKESLLVDLFKKINGDKNSKDKPITYQKTLSRIVDLADMGVFGKTKKNPGDKKEDPALSGDVWRRTLEIQKKFQAEIEKTPNMSPEEIQVWLNGEINPDLIKNGFGEKPPGFWSALGLGMFKAMTGTEDEDAGSMTDAERRKKASQVTP